jgi:hypothetical protein
MTDEEEKQDRRGFKVEDRRRFTDSGEVRLERQDAPQPEQPAEPAAQATAAPASSAPASSTTQSARPEVPPFDLNFSTFVISLSTQALAHLGEIQNPIDPQMAVDLGAAKQLIDILGILKEKTKGNLDQAEAGLLDNVLYDLRLRYVELVRSR